MLLERQGRPLLAEAYGLASRSGNIPNRLDTRFNLASINKIFTHVAIEQLADQGTLSLDDTIDRFLPDYPEANGKRITVRMLLDHRAGVTDVLNQERVRRDPEGMRTQADWYDVVREAPLEFEPGTKERYSNGGFVLLGEIIARVSGEDYYDYIRRHIYEPAGMTRADHYTLDEPVDGMADGYTRDPEGGQGAAGRQETPVARLGRAVRPVAVIPRWKIWPASLAHCERGRCSIPRASTACSERSPGS